MERGYYTDDSGLTHLIKVAYADNGDGKARRVLKAYVGDKDNRARLWLQYRLLVQSIAVITPPNRTVYSVGDSFSPAGMVVEATYQTGGPAVITDYTYTPAGPLSTGDTEITIHYEINGTSASTTVPITVTTQTFYVVGLAVTTPPDKTGYFYGDAFDKSGLVVTASYSDNSTADVTENCIFSPDGALTHSDTVIKITYTENGFTVTTSQAVTVVRKLMSIAVTAPPSKTEYKEGETFSRAGMVVTAKYNDGTDEPVTSYTHAPTGQLKVTDDTITVSYTENGITRTATQKIEVHVAASPVFAENDWATISRISASGQAQDYWSVGDEKVITLTTGLTLTLQIYGFDHDDLADGSGKAGITLGMKGTFQNGEQMNATDTNATSFFGSSLKTMLDTTMWQSLPPDFQAVIKPVDKLTSAGGISQTLRTDAYRLFLLSATEVGQVGGAVSGEGVQYPIFTDAASRLKYIEGTSSAYDWWHRSPTRGNPTNFTTTGSTALALTTPARASTYQALSFACCV